MHVGSTLSAATLTVHPMLLSSASALTRGIMIHAQACISNVHGVSIVYIETLSGRIFHIEILMEKFIKLCNVYYYHPKGQSFVNVNKSVRLIICFRDYSIWWINSSIKMCWILCKTQCLIIPLMESALHIMYLYLWIDLSLHHQRCRSWTTFRLEIIS